MRLHAAACLAGLVLLQGCVGGPGLDDLSFACKATSDCLDGWSCVNGTCRRDGTGGGGGSGTGGGGGAVDSGAGGGTGTGTGGGGGSGEEDGGVAPADAGVAQLELTPSSHGFGEVTVMTSSAPQPFVISNVGGAASGLVSVTLAGADASRFSLTTTCASALSPGGTCTATVRFTPTSTGPANASLEVHADPGGALSATLTGLARTAARLTASQAAHQFGAVTVGAFGTPQTITVTNSGGSSSGLPILRLEGANPDQFEVQMTTCSAPLQPGSTCAVVLGFNPTSEGVQAATLTVSGAPGGAQSISLEGTGLLPAAFEVSPSPASFPAVVAGQASAPVTVTVTNTGGAPAPSVTTVIGGSPAAGDFTIDPASNTCAGQSLAAGAPCSLVVRCTPGAVGVHRATLTVSSGAVTATTPLNCQGLPAAALTVTPGMQAFGDVSTGATATAVFRVQNTGGVNSGTVAPLVSGQDFALDPTQTTCAAALAPQASCLVAVRFSPTAQVARTGTLSVTSSPGGAATASLSGTGVPPGNLSVSPAGNAFGSVPLLASSSPVTFTITNTGASATVTPSVQLSGDGAAQFTQTNTCTGPIPGGSACSVSVRFAPTARGAASAFLRVSAASSQVTASLSGQGLAPASLSLDQTTLQFPDTVVGVTAPIQTLQLTNTGDVASSAVMAGVPPSAFGLQGDGCDGGTLLPQASCTMEIAFSPYSGGAVTSNFTAGATQGGNVVATLRGTGLTAASLSVMPAFNMPVDFGNVVMPGTAQQVVTVTNAGQVPTGPLTFGLGGADGAMFSLSGGTCAAGAPLAPGAMCTLQVSFTPSSRGARSATVTISASPGGTRMRTLLGVGQLPATLSPAMTTRDLGQVDVGVASSTQTWTLSNSGDLPTGALSLTNSNASELQVVSSTCSGTLAPAATCVITAALTPSAPGARTGTLTLSGAAGGPASLTLTAEGAWRLSLTALAAGGTLSTADGRITACTSTSPPSSCSALYTSGSFVTVRARTSNGGGAHFSGWQSPSACAASGTGSDCAVTLTAHQAASARFRAVTSNLAFVSSTYEPANRGGVSQYDARCNALATAAGINSATGDGFIAWMSAQTQLANVASVAAGATHAVSVKTDGTVWAWGANAFGQLGDGSTSARVVPVAASALTGMMSVAAGGAHTVAVKSDGTLWVWGRNDQGQLGDPSAVSKQTTPLQLTSVAMAKVVAAGEAHTVMVKSDGSVWAWGANDAGQLGDGSLVRRLSPVKLQMASAVAGVAAGKAHTLAVTTTGAVFSWGDNSAGQLGSGSMTGSTVPLALTGFTATAVAAGSDHSAALTTSGEVLTWGDNTEGQLGDGSTKEKATPVEVPQLSNVRAIAAGAAHTVALKTDGTVWAWGLNDVGQLGDGTTTSQPSPVQVRGVTNAVAVGAGGRLTVVVKSDGSIQSFGLDQTPAGLRLTAAGAFRRMDGALVATSRAELTSGLVSTMPGAGVAAGRVLAPIDLDETGRRVPQTDGVWTGTTSKGEHSLGNDCSGWSALTGTAQRGLVKGGPGLWTVDSAGAATPCSSATTRIVCLGITSDTTSALDVVPTSGKIGFLSPPFSIGTGGRAALDAHCNANRPSAYMTRTFAAHVATSTETASSRVTAGGTWYRPDGTLIGSTQALQSGALEAGVWQTNTGDYVAGTVLAWTGASSSMALGAKGTTCDGWTDPASTALRGRATSAGADAFSTGATASCGSADTRVICLER